MNAAFLLLLRSLFHYDQFRGANSLDWRNLRASWHDLLLCLGLPHHILSSTNYANKEIHHAINRHHRGKFRYW